MEMESDNNGLPPPMPQQMESEDQQETDDPLAVPQDVLKIHPYHYGLELDTCDILEECHENFNELTNTLINLAVKDSLEKVDKTEENNRIIEGNNRMMKAIRMMEGIKTIVPIKVSENFKNEVHIKMEMDRLGWGMRMSTPLKTSGMEGIDKDKFIANDEAIDKEEATEKLGITQIEGNMMAVKKVSRFYCEGFKWNYILVNNKSIGGLAASTDCTNKVNDRMVPNGRKKFVGICKFCFKEFKAKSHLTRHECTHTKNYPFRCQQCSYSCATKSGLKRHENGVHNDIRIYDCPKCDLKFTTEFNRKSHLKCHSDERPFECHLCSYTSKRSSTMVTHMTSHMRAKQYACNFCNKIFNCKYNIFSHRLREHESEMNTTTKH